MRVIDHREEREDDHFVEGEPDLEPPEEAALSVVDDETLLEEDLDSRADLEDDLDEDVLQDSLDHLVHDGEDEEALGTEGLTLDLEVEDLEDREESLDQILRHKLEGDADPARPEDDRALDGLRPSEGGASAPTGRDEFVCRSCFLVRHAWQVADAAGMLCRDCLEAGHHDRADHRRRTGRTRTVRS
jgi:hypothetical protein